MIPRKKSKKIVVDGLDFYCLIKKKEDKGKEFYSIKIQHENFQPLGLKILNIIPTDGSNIDDYGDPTECHISITPKMLADLIKEYKNNGMWNYDQKGSIIEL